ncbi:MAG: glycosyltransferase family 2 protein [Planctomycetota bacterium]
MNYEPRRRHKETEQKRETKSGRQKAHMNLSIVTTLYKSESFVKEFHRRISAVAKKHTDDFEIVYVDDGSPDGSGKAVRELAGDARTILVELSRNFGHHPAMMAGLAHAKGDRIFLLDVDLEEEPEWLSSFWLELESKDADVVYAVQGSRIGGPMKRISGWLFYSLFNLMSETRIPRNLCTARLMTKPYVDALLSAKDSNIFLAGLMSWAGFRQVPIKVKRSPRPNSSGSSYTFTRMISLALDALTSFTSYPLKVIFILGLIISTISGGVGLYLLLRKLIAPDSIGITGWPSIMVSIWFLGGIIIFFIGVVGIYISKIFAETKERPIYIVRKIHRP